MYQNLENRSIYDEVLDKITVWCVPFGLIPSGPILGFVNNTHTCGERDSASL